MKTRQISTLPGSEGLYSPRWSPDGRYIAALRVGSETLQILDVRTKKWTELAKILVGFPMWSWDSKYIYFDSLEGVPNLYRVRIADHSLEKVASLRGIRLAPTLGGNLTGLASDDSPLVVLNVGAKRSTRLIWSCHRTHGAVSVRPRHPNPDASQSGVREAAVVVARILFRASFASLEFLPVVSSIRQRAREN